MPHAHKNEHRNARRDARKPAFAQKNAPASQAQTQAAQWRDAWLDHLGKERRLSAHTTLNYRRDVDALLALAGATPLAQLRAQDIRRFVAALHARGLEGKSLARMLSAWRGFYRYLTRDDARAPDATTTGVTQNPVAGLRAPKAQKTLPQALSPDAAARLMELPMADEKHPALAIRDKAMFELFYSSGLRLSELAQLDVQDVNVVDATVRVVGKGSKERIVPVGKFALAALAAWRAQRAALIHDSATPALFVNKDGARLGQAGIQYRMKRWARKIGLDGTLHPHQLRHSFASHLLQSSGDLRAVQELLGHASISTTQVYTHLDFQYLAKIYDQAHPRAKRVGATEKTMQDAAQDIAKAPQHKK